MKKNVGRRGIINSFSESLIINPCRFEKRMRRSRHCQILFLIKSFPAINSNQDFRHRPSACLDFREFGSSISSLSQVTNSKSRKLYPRSVEPMVPNDFDCFFGFHEVQLFFICKASGFLIVDRIPRFCDLVPWDMHGFHCRRGFYGFRGIPASSHLGKRICAGPGIVKSFFSLILFWIINH